MQGAESARRERLRALEPAHLQPLRRAHEHVLRLTDLPVQATMSRGLRHELLR